MADWSFLFAEFEFVGQEGRFLAFQSSPLGGKNIIPPSGRKSKDRRVVFFPVRFHAWGIDYLILRFLLIDERGDPPVNVPLDLPDIALTILAPAFADNGLATLLLRSKLGRLFSAA